VADGPFQFDRVKDTTTTTGTGAVTLSGTAPTGYRTFGSVLSDTNLVHYVIAHQSAAEWETGVGTYSTTGPTLTRTRVKDSSAGVGTAVSFSAGTKDVFIGPAATQLGWVPEMTPPPTSGWTWDNQGSGTLTLWGNNCRSIYSPAPASAENLRVQYRSAPTAPYKVEFGILPTVSAQDFGAACVAWRSSGGAYRGLFIRDDAAGYARFMSTGGATGGTLSGVNATRVNNCRGPILFVRLEDDNTNRLISVSADAVNWVTMESEARATGFTPNAVAWGVWAYDKTVANALVHYREY
jgi:hypothetical protein